MRFVCLLLFAYGLSAHAEYRAFELVIVDATSGQEKVILSTLDPLQYRRYYPLKADDQVTYRDTWRCRGNTSGHRPICQKPEKPATK